MSERPEQTAQPEPGDVGDAWDTPYGRSRLEDMHQNNPDLAAELDRGRKRRKAWHAKRSRP